MSTCGTTHYEGCECNEARWQERLSVERNEVLRLREELKLSEAKRLELIFALQDAQEEFSIIDGLKEGFEEDYIVSAQDHAYDALEAVNKALASQPRPKILDVLAAAQALLEKNPKEADDQDERTLRTAVAAMEKE